jgi:hypothetical protein
MVDVLYDDHFKKVFSKIKNLGLRERISKLIEKIIKNPELGKPMMYKRKGTREVYLQPFRLAYLIEGDTLTFLDLYHKDEQ